MLKKHVPREHSLLMTFFWMLTLFFVIWLITYGIFVGMVYKTNLTIADNVISSIHNQMTEQLQQFSQAVDNALYTFNYSPTIQSLFEDGSNLTAFSLSDNLRSVSASAFLTNDLAGIAIFDMEGVYLWGSRYNYFSINGLPEELRQANVNIVTSIYQDTDISTLNNCYCAISPVYRMRLPSRTLGKQLGYTVFTFQTELLQKNILAAESYENSIIILTDQNGYPFISTKTDIVDKQTLQEILNAPSVVKLSNSIDNPGWTLYSILPSNIISNIIYPILRMIVITAFVMLIFMVLFFQLLRNKIFIPISRIGVFMKWVPTNQTAVRFPIKEDNELGQMIYFMNRMLDELEQKNSKLRYLENCRLAAEITQKKMEILAYRNQVNPHFLYNTLNCIRGMALENDSWEIAEMAESLSSIFRYAVKESSIVTVEEELSYVREYALIISKRFAGRMTINIHAENAALPVQTNKMFLQPLVENAVQHGLEQKPGTGLIEIYVQVLEDRLIYTVHDDGIGIPPQRLEEIRTSIYESQLDRIEEFENEQHIGLSNLARRLHLLYGNSVCLNIDSTQGNGTTVIVSFPIREEIKNV